MITVKNSLLNIKNNIMPFGKSANKSTATALAFLMSLQVELAGATELPEIVVSEKAQQQNEGYQSGKTTIGKMSQAAKDIPQSLTIVNKNLIQDRNADSLHEALRNVAGLTFNAGEGGRIGDNITIRGFGASSDLYLDGLRDNAQYNRDTFNIEQVEVLRGPSSMLFGRGSTGGVVNQAQKEPGLDLSSTARVVGGSYNYTRETLDFNNNLSDSSAVRINLMKTDTDSSRDHVQHHSLGIAPSVKFGIGTDNELLLSYMHLGYHDVPDFGIPISNAQNGKPISVPNTTFYGLAKEDYQNDSADVISARFIHKVDKNNELKLNARTNMVERDLRAVAPSYNANTDLVNRGRQARGAHENTSTLQGNYNSKFAALGMKHETLLGVEYIDENASRWSYASSPANLPTSPGNPDNYTLPAGYGATYQRINPQRYTDNDLGLYGQDLLQFAPHWKLLLGARYDDFHAKYNSRNDVNNTTLLYERRDRVWSYRSGLLYQPTDFATYYASYGTAFNPSGDLYAIEALTSSNAANTAPEKSINMESGVKWELFGGDLSLRTAVFRSEKTNERNTDQTNTSVTLLSGRRHTDGIELEASGKLTKKWEMFGGISLMRSKIDKHVNPNGEGLQPVNTPNVSGNFWNTYRINPNWRIGGGVDFVSKRYGYSISQTPGAGGVYPTPVIRHVPGYARVDAMAQWDHNQYTIKLNVLNLTNRNYYDAIYTNGGFAIPGQRRSFQLSVAYKF